jgi:Peptidase family M48
MLSSATKSCALKSRKAVSTASCFETVAMASHIAGIRSPKLDIIHLKQGGYAVYLPLTHKVCVSSVVVNKVSQNHVQTLIAHEIGHAKQRREILMDALRYLVPAPFALIIFGLFAVWLSSSGLAVAAFFAFMFGLCLFYTIERFASPYWCESVARRELEANSFANAFMESSIAIECAITACELAHVSVLVSAKSSD